VKGTGHGFLFDRYFSAHLEAAALTFGLLPDGRAWGASRADYT